MEKTQFIINDFLLFEEFCNLRCDYCGGFYPTEYLFKRRQNRLIYPEVWDSIRRANKTLEKILDKTPKVSQLFELASKTLEEQDKYFEYPILKLSGGEIFLVKETMDFIKSMSERFKAVQVLTNGTLLKESHIGDIAELGNVYIQLSLDGHTLETNKTRTKKAGILKKVLRNVELIQEKNMPLEINCVLTKHNIDYLTEFISYMSQYPDIVVFPRTVRGKPAEMLSPENFTIEKFKSLINADYKALPPKEYMKRLFSLILHEKRNWKCHVPSFVLGTDMYGNVSRCTLCSNSTKLTNILEPDKEFLLKLEGKTYHNPTKEYSSCPDNCIVHYEMLNLYVEGRIGEEELTKIPVFRVGGVIEKIKEIKKDLLR
ncbi:MAG: radical SAM protein [Nanoarchaeota archaeon]|nr:radical SAM protein [Nanoarchaeota archaeon]